MGKKKESKSIHTVRINTNSSLMVSKEILEQAAQDGDMEAQYNLGVMYMIGGCGCPVTKEIVETAIFWFNQSAEQYYPAALYALGNIYLGTKKECQRVGIGKDVAKALEYFIDAAIHGHTDAQYRAGVIYKEALNKKEALKYLIPAAQMNHREAQYQVGLIYEENFETQREALEWFTKAAEQESPHKDAQYRIAMMYLEGRGVPRNPATAVSWLNKAASVISIGRAHSGAQYRLGLMHMKGEGVIHNSRRGVELLDCAAVRGLAEAQYYLGIAYEEGHGVARDEIKALGWLTKAAEGNHPEAQFYLGRKYEEGRGIARDETKALEWLTKAAEGNHPEAPFRLGMKYEEGQGAARDEIKALEWLTKAVKENHPEAKTYLCSLIEKRVSLNHIYPSIKQLIRVVQNVLGNEHDVSKMFRALLQEETPELEDKVFYYYTYEIYSSKEEIPATKQPDIVYLYIENDRLHYQMLKHCSSSSKDGEVYSDRLEVPVDFNLGRLKDVSWVDAPLTRENIRKIYPIFNDAKTKCIYSVTTDKGGIEVGYIETNPEEGKDAIESRLLDELKKHGYCFSKEDNLISLRKDLDAQLIQNGLFEPSYEMRTALEYHYEEICAYEDKFRIFLDRLIENLMHSGFNNLLEGDEAFEILKNSIVTIANKLKLNQDKICRNLAVKFQNSSKMIDTLKVAYQTTINLEDFHNMSCLMRQLNGFFDKLPQSQKKLMNIFFQNHPELLLDNYSTLCAFPVMFSAQLLTRRKILFESLAKCFMKGHPKIYELEEIFVKLSGMVSTSYMAYGSSNPQVMLTIQTNLDQEDNLFKNICLELVKPIWNLLIMATQQTEVSVIYTSLLGRQKPIILEILSFLQEQVRKILQTENRGIFCPTAEEIFGIITKEILPRDEVEQILLDIVKETSPTAAERIMGAKAEERAQVMVEEILQGEAKGTLSDKARQTLGGMIEKILQAEMDGIDTLAKKIRNTCDLNDMVCFLVEIIPLIGDLALTLSNQKINPNTSKSRANNLSDPNLKVSQDTGDRFFLTSSLPKSERKRSILRENGKGSHVGLTIGFNRNLCEKNGRESNVILDDWTDLPTRTPTGGSARDSKRLASMQSLTMGNCLDDQVGQSSKRSANRLVFLGKSSAVDKEKPNSFLPLNFGK